MVARWCLAAVLLGALAPAARAQVPATGNPSVKIRSLEAGRIRGVVFDSLLMKPVPGANVMLMDGTQSAVSDSRGRFEIVDVPPGAHFVAFNTPQLDSLGLGTLGASVDVPAGAVAQVNVTTPSFRTLWNLRCGPSAALSSDSGIVWGTIRDARTDSTLGGATAAFNWYDLKSGMKAGLLLNEVHREVDTNNGGQYFACGLPTDIVISSTAFGTQSASGTVQYAIGERRLHRVDLLVSTDMVIPDSVHFATAADSLAADRARGNAIVRGVVTGGKGRPLSNAIVEIASADTSVRTSSDGRFLINGLPAGTHVVQVRGVGFAPATQLVDLRPGQAAEVDVQLSTVNTLSMVNVRADFTRGSDRLDYESRRRMGVGYAMESKALAQRVDLASVLSTFPGVNVQRTASGFSVTMPGTTHRTCTPAAFLDGLPTDFDAANMRRPEEYRAIEVFTRGGTVPAQYSTLSGCGSILFWSRNARW